MRALELALRDDELGGQNLNYCNFFVKIGFPTTLGYL